MVAPIDFHYDTLIAVGEIACTGVISLFLRNQHKNGH